ncbi:MAG: hypothetical protein WC659_01930 [Patescibacteria group bacterium]
MLEVNEISHQEVHPHEREDSLLRSSSFNEAKVEAVSGEAQ